MSAVSRIGVPREIKDGERRVGVTPDGAGALVRDGHVVVVEHGAGRAVGFADEAYAAAGATLGDADAAWACDVVVKVKELQAAEYARLRSGLLVLGFAQLNRDAALLEANALMSLRAHDEAADVLEAVRTPTRADIEFALGKARRAMGENEKALASFRAVYYGMPLAPEADDAGAQIKLLVPGGPYGTLEERKQRAEQ